MSWFECKVEYTKLLETGLQKKVNEPYLVDAMSFTEAEARVIEEVAPFISADFKISAVKRTKYTEIVYDETGDKWYSVKINIITIDEVSGKEKKQSVLTLVQASNFQNAVDNFMAFMKGTISDFDIVNVTETAIMDVFPFKVSDNSQE